MALHDRILFNPLLLFVDILFGTFIIFNWQVKAGRTFADYHRLLPPGEKYEGTWSKFLLMISLNPSCWFPINLLLKWKLWKNCCGCVRRSELRMGHVNMGTKKSLGIIPFAFDLDVYLNLEPKKLLDPKQMEETHLHFWKWVFSAKGTGSISLNHPQQ